MVLQNEDNVVYYPSFPHLTFSFVELKNSFDVLLKENC